MVQIYKNTTKVQFLGNKKSLPLRRLLKSYEKV